MLDFEGLNRHLLSDARSLLPQWLPGGRLQGYEYVCGNLLGSSGSSCKINIQTGLWADFASNHRGGDLISLYAAINSLTQKQAFKHLSEQYNIKLDQPKGKEPTKRDGLNPVPEISLIQPPKGTLLPDFQRKPSAIYRYKDINGDTLFLITRNDQGEKKTFCPWSWSTNNKWVKKAWPAPRPLYNLDKLHQNPSKPVLLVEGEKACYAAEQTTGGKYVCMTWPGGSSAIKHIDWEPLTKRHVLIWPDADKPGIKAALEIAKIIHKTTASLKIIDVNPDNNGEDAADAEFDYKSFLVWAKPLAYEYPKPVAAKPKPALPKPIPKKLTPLKPEPPKPIPAPSNQEPPATTDPEETEKPKPEHHNTWVNLGLALNAHNRPINNMQNVINILSRFKPLKDLIWYDEFHFKYLTKWRSNTVREWTDIDDYRLTYFLQDKLGFSNITDVAVSKAVMTFANENIKNEPKDWLNSLKWDQTSRLEDFFHKYFGTESTPYTQAISRNFWVSMVARIYEPGCKVDNMVIMEGKQGKFKSTALSLIGGPWYVETNENPNSKDFYQIFQGKLVIEIGEMDSFNKAETTTIKKIISTGTDRFRPPYGKHPKDFPRQCIFVGTTNEHNYLRDHTGARRFWPIKIADINTELIKQDREQLFAEAVSLYKSGTKWHSVPDTAAAEQDKRRETDPWEEIISLYLIGKSETTVMEICQSSSGLDMPIERVNRQVQLRIGRILRILNWESAGSRRRAGRVVKIYVPSETDDNTPPSADNSGNSVTKGSGESFKNLQNLPNFAPQKH